MKTDGLFNALDIATSALNAEMKRSEIVASNLSNMHSTRGGPDGGPYRRRSVVFEEMLTEAQGSGVGNQRLANGVRVAGVYEDQTTPFIERYDPGHPDADGNGMVQMPNVDVFNEMVDMMVIERSFQANLTALRNYRQMLQDTIRNLTS
jgi:flagellar basal-body rod protein FlgC